MVRSSPSNRTVRRRGIVLLIVLAMLALFAIVGLSFVFYADSAADSARFRRQAETLGLGDATPEKLFAYALGQLIFDTDNPNSKMRGHSLGRSLYGSPGGTVPFNGIGRPHPDTKQTLEGLTPFDGINVPYTYPDINNPFLAGLDPDNPGYLKERSFFRNGSSLRPLSLGALPANGEGDVRNIDSLDGTISPTNPGLTLYNDAFWTDLDFPVMTAKDGTRFKPLFAITVLDLDGRLNLSVSGNYRADYTKSGGTSRCGLGTWEINPARVLAIDKTEIAQLLYGGATAPSRYGADYAPDYPVRFPRTFSYSRVDFAGTSPDAIARASVPYSHLPTYGSAWVDSGFGEPPVLAHLPSPPVQHAAGFDYFGARSPAAAAGDLAMAASNAEAILRWRDRGAPALTSDLIRLLPKNLTPRGTSGAQILNLVTPVSMSLDTAHLAPFFAGDPNTKFQWAPGDPYPKSTTVTQTVPQALLAGAGEFSADFRSQIAAALPRINLNRDGSTTVVSAEEARILVNDIFNRLVRVTGALHPSQGAPFQPANRVDPQYKATRWLAQLAVNIYDFMDYDTDMTVFLWNPGPNPTEADYVFGVEMNDLVINEAYVSADNDSADKKKYRVNAWAELYNPRNKNASAWQLAGFGFPSRTAFYRLLLAENVDGIAESPTGLPKNYYYAQNDPKLGVADWPVQKSVLPGDMVASGSNGAGFFLVGSPASFSFFPSRKPNWTNNVGQPFQWDHTSPGMQSGQKSVPADVDSLSNLKATLVLQRMATPIGAPVENPADPKYNPYVTIDVFPDIPIHNSVVLDNARDLPLGGFRSVGRYQPLQASNVKPQNPSPAREANGNEPQHTFGRQNTRNLNAPVNDDTLKRPFDTIYHFDRTFISTAEALLVPAAPPSEVTQRFANPQLPLSAFNICQNDVNSLLFRFLETVTTGDRSYSPQLAPYSKTGLPLTGFNGGPPTILPKDKAGIAGSGLHAILVPGKINLNTVNDERVVQALFDRQSNSVFSDEDVHQFWLDLLNIRKSRAIAGFSDYTLDPNTRALTLHNTLLGNLFKKMSDRAAQAGADHYERTDGWRKVMNNITFTSNVFAVWLTAGFFEVDAVGNPIQEIGKNENRTVRHRMFAIVDRSQLVLPAPPSSQPFTTLVGGVAKNSTTATVGAAIGALQSQDPTLKADFSWQIKAGTVLTIDRGQINEERVVVQAVSGNQIQVGGVGFLQPHNSGAPVDFCGIQGPQAPLNRGPDGTTVPNFILGYPGPQPRFNLREYSYVVPYCNIID